MIKNIKFSNFYSFHNEQEISFVAKKKETYDYFQSKSGDQITKVAGFVGGNASGKTNIMRLFSFISFFVSESSKNNKPNFDIASKTFFNNLEPSKFNIEFEEKGYTFFYEFSIQKNRILKEDLSVKKIENNSRKAKLFSRELDNIILNEQYFSGFPKASLKHIRSDVSLIAYIKANYSVDIIDVVHSYFSRIKTNINEKGDRNSVYLQIESFEIYLSDVKIKKDMENFVQLFDIGLDGFEISKKTVGNNTEISVQGVHTTGGKENSKLAFQYESNGTQSLFFTLANILVSLRDNSVVVIDEIETGLHPEALNKIISYFIAENKDRNAQILFSSHSLGFMNKLDMHQIYLVEKNKKSESLVYRLNQVEGVRSDENFLTKYMAGSYGAFPKIKI
ncbi:MAG: ATP-binding protein [Minisyncoccia bacterium]